MAKLSNHLCECGCGQRTNFLQMSWAKKGWIKGEPRRFVHGHSIPIPIETRFWSKVKKTEGCWLWIASFARHGYGAFSDFKAKRTFKAHRFSYALANGSIAKDLVIDHKCFVRNCVNPAHLEAVTQAENLRRSRVRKETERGELLKEAILQLG